MALALNIINGASKCMFNKEISNRDTKLNISEFSLTCSRSKCLKRAPLISLGITLPVGSLNSMSTALNAKFKQFESVDSSDVSMQSEVGAEDEATEDLESDRFLPNDLEGAIMQASSAAALFSSAGGKRAVVELLIPELESMGEEGSQQRMWDIGRIFLENYQQQLNGQKVKALFPDAGSAALLRHRWKDATFSIGSLSDRKAVTDDDDAVVFVAPDFQMLSDVERIAKSLLDDDEDVQRPLIMWNPRLVSGDVGVGLNVRRLRENFLSTFMTVYHLRPLSTGAVFRCYPEPWKMYLDNPEKPGRYILYREQAGRPDMDDIEALFMATPSGDSQIEEPSIATKALSVMSSFSRFMKALTN